MLCAALPKNILPSVEKTKNKIDEVLQGGKMLCVILCTQLRISYLVKQPPINYNQLIYIRCKVEIYDSLMFQQ